MELKSPKTKKKPSRETTWSKMFRTPMILLFLLGTSSCDNELSFSADMSMSNSTFKEVRHRHSHMQPSDSESKLVDNIKYLRRHLNKEVVNFVMTDVLVDGEVENRVHYNGITAKETYVGTYGCGSTGHYVNKSPRGSGNRAPSAARATVTCSSGGPAPGTNAAAGNSNQRRVDLYCVDNPTGRLTNALNGLRLRQLTDGRHLVQLIYTPNGELQDCEYMSERKSTRNFLKTLRKELKLALDEELYKVTQKETSSREEEKFFRHFGNVTFRILKSDVKLPPDIESWLDYSKLKMECLKRHEELKYMVENKNKVGEAALTRSRRSVRENFIVPGTKWCGAGQLAQEYKELGSNQHEDRCCRAHDSCRVNIGAFRRRFGYFNFRPFTISHCKCDRRAKRDAMDILRVPGTKWCGKGFSATRYSQLGGYTRTDRCCRVHDLRCPFWIGALENKYGLYNWRVNTLMHCRCDERFRACLKLADTPVSNMVGKLFFNVVQSKCFVLKPVKLCMRRSWWGRCLKRGYAKQAFLRDNLPY